jgi:hypothetical protein
VYAPAPDLLACIITDVMKAKHLDLRSGDAIIFREQTRSSEWAVHSVISTVERASLADSS